MKKQAKMMVGCAALLACGTTAFYQGRVVRRYAQVTGKWRCGVPVRFVVVSDLHNLMHGERQADLLADIRALRPDYILLPGDIFDVARPPAAARDFLLGAAALAPTYYAPGNHEYRTHQLPAILRLVRCCGIIPLLDESVQLDTRLGPLLLAGCEDTERIRQGDRSYDAAFAFQTAFEHVAGSGAYTVLLAHRPEHIERYSAAGFELVISGHTHGGFGNIPLLMNGFFASGQGFFPRYAGGRYRWRNGTTHIISRGLATYQEFPRVFNPPEIVVVDVNGKMTG